MRSTDRRIRVATMALAVCVGAGSALAQQFAELRKIHLPRDESNTEGLAFGDVDGDGDTDLVICRDLEVALLLGSGDTRFTPAAAGRIPPHTGAFDDVALGDVDGDADLDLIVAAIGQNRLWLNDGTGGFEDATTRLPADTDSTFAVVVLDVDADGDLDAVFGTAFGQNRLYVNDGSGRFSDATSRLPTGIDQTYELAFGDVDGDSDPDLVVARGAGSVAGLLLNDGTGRFTDASGRIAGGRGAGAHGVALGDVDGDGDLDLVFAVFGGDDGLYLNDGTGSFSDASARLPNASRYSHAVALCDADSDGDLDVVTGGYIERARIHANDGTGRFTDVSAAALPVDRDVTNDIVAADLDGDGHPELVFATGTGARNRLLVDAGNGTFVDATASGFETVSPVNAFALVDVDSDGDLDCVTGSRGDATRLFRNVDGTFVEDGSGAIQARTDRTAAILGVDVDGDGDEDLVVGNQLNEQDRLLLNDGTGRFIDATASRMPRILTSTNAVVAGDVDGDGDPDLVFAMFDTPCLLYLNDGTGSFTVAGGGRLPSASELSTDLALGDVDGDGDLDLVIAVSGRQNRLLLNDGTGRFVDVSASRLPVETDTTLAVAAADFDADGDLDLVFGGSRTSSFYRNDGSGGFLSEPWRMPAHVGTAWAIEVGDLDEDGDLDLVFADAQVQNRVFLNDGGGRFADFTASRMQAGDDNTMALALGDIDGDGDLDLLAGNSRPPARLFHNLHRQVFAPFLAQVGTRFALTFSMRPGYGTAPKVAVGALAPITTRIPVPPYGAWRLDPATMLILPPLLLPAPAGVAVFTLDIARVPALRGFTIHAQFAMLDPEGNPRLSNLVTEPIR